MDKTKSKLWGHSINAVKIHLWIAVIAYLLDSTVSIEFQAINNVPKEAMLFSFQEITDITAGLQTACEMLKKETDFERLGIVESMANSFQNFLDAWVQNENETGSYFSTIETV